MAIEQGDQKDKEFFLDINEANKFLVEMEYRAIELVDCMIVILDVLAAHNVDIEGLLRKKHAINSQRPYQHGRTI